MYWVESESADATEILLVRAESQLGTTDVFLDYRLIPEDASPGDPSRLLRIRLWKGVSFWKDCDKPLLHFVHVKTAFEGTYQGVKELLRAGAWDARIDNILSDLRMTSRVLPQWRNSKKFSDTATPGEVCQFYDGLVAKFPDPSTYTPLLSELFAALQVSQGVKVPLASDSARAWRPCDNTAFRL